MSGGDYEPTPTRPSCVQGISGYLLLRHDKAAGLTRLNATVVRLTRSARARRSVSREKQPGEGSRQTKTLATRHDRAGLALYGTTCRDRAALTEILKRFFDLAGRPRSSAWPRIATPGQRSSRSRALARDLDFCHLKRHAKPVPQSPTPFCQARTRLSETSNGWTSTRLQDFRYGWCGETEKR